MVCYDRDGNLFILGTVNLATCVVKPIGVILRDRFSAPKRASEGCVVLSPGDLPGQDRTARDTRTRNGSRLDGTPRPPTRDSALPLLLQHSDTR